MARASTILAVVFLLLSSVLANAGVDETYDRPSGTIGFSKFVERLIGRPVFHESYAVIIGISDYKNFAKLSAPVADAVKVRNFLKDEAGFDHIILLTDEKATRERIEHIMEGVLPTVVGQDDRVLFYFSGHGATRFLANVQRGYLILAASEENAWDTMIDMPRVAEWSQNLDQARHVLFLLDACFSGLAGMDIEKKAGGVGDVTASRLIQSAHQIATAGVEGESSYAIDGESIFTSLFLAAARGQLGHSDDNIIGLNEIMVDVNRGIDQKRSVLGDVLKMTPHVYQTRYTDNAGEFFFRPSGDNAAPEASTPPVGGGKEEDPSKRIAELEGLLRDADAKIKRLEQINALAEDTGAPPKVDYSEPIDEKCDPFALSASAIGRIRVKQRVQDSGQKAGNGRSFFTNSFSLAFDAPSINPDNPSAIPSCILEAVDHVVYKLNPNWFSPSEITSRNAGDLFAYRAKVWGSTAIGATIYLRGTTQPPIEMKGFFGTQDGLDTYLQRAAS